VATIVTHSTTAEWLAKNPVLLAKVVDHPQLALVHPPGDGDQYESKWIQESRLR
jgi:hypothetical protein